MDPNLPKRIPSDSELLDATQKGDEEAAAELCRRHDPAILLAIKAFLFKHRCDRPHDHAEEVKNEAWIKIFSHLNDLREVDKFPAWRDAIARNEAKGHLRKCISGRFVDLEENQPRLPKGLIVDDRKVIENAELIDKSLAVAESISPKLAQIIVLLNEEEYSWDEIAELFGENKETLRTFYNRGLIKLRRKLGGRGG